MNHYFRQAAGRWATRLTLWAGVLSSSLGQVAEARIAPPADQPPANRLETEYKLAVPRGQEAAIWRWLQTHYAVEKPRQLGAGWKSELGEETFEDRYFDDAHRTLLHARAGVRHRRRFEAGALKKQLVQIKVTDDAAGLLREEFKFKPMEGATDTTALAALLRPADRARFDSALALLHVQLPDLHSVLTLGQLRRRVYLRLDGNDFSTITFDSSYNMGAQPAGFTEIEVELNEKRFTGASATERTHMQTVLRGLRDDLLHQFPGLKQDQRPKYNKLAALLAAAPAPESVPASPWMPGPRLPVWLLGLLVATAAWALTRQMRQRTG